MADSPDLRLFGNKGELIPTINLLDLIVTGFEQTHFYWITWLLRLGL